MTARRLSIVALALFVALALAAPLAAQQPDCEELCNCSTARCIWPCNDGGANANCGLYGLCIGLCVDWPSSVAPADALLQSIFAVPPATPLPAPDAAAETSGRLKR